MVDDSNPECLGFRFVYHHQAEGNAYEKHQPAIEELPPKPGAAQQVQLRRGAECPVKHPGRADRQKNQQRNQHPTLGFHHVLKKTM